MDTIPDSISICGLYCGACPTFNKTCYGCRSEVRNPEHLSKFECKIRRCCLEKKGNPFCGLCEKYPCKKLTKLIESHPKDDKYSYRHEIPSNLQNIHSKGWKTWLKEQEEKWKCPECGGVVQFYTYKCADCDYKSEM
jgi:hypothetical protein